MIFSTIFTFALLAIAQVFSVSAAPAAEPLGPQAREILARATPAAPHWVAYSDAWTGSTLPATSAIKGFNVFILSFLLLAGPWDNAQVWVSLSAAERSTIKSQYAAAGIKLIVSAFGSTDIPTSSGVDPVATANSMAAFVKQYDLDGIDVDYEDFGAMDAQNGSAENWLISFTKQLRVNLPTGQYIVTHAPVAPWFGKGLYASGAYLKVHQSVGSLIDWYNVQFYNQNQYTTCDGLFNTSTAPFANSAVFQIAASGVPLSKIVVGKPAQASGDANNGYIDPGTLATCFSQAKAQGWNGGGMVWQYPHAASSWITTVRSKSWPV